jgi:hypothetical protein
MISLSMVCKWLSKVSPRLLSRFGKLHHRSVMSGDIGGMWMSPTLAEIRSAKVKINLRNQTSYSGSSISKLRDYLRR